MPQLLTEPALIPVPGGKRIAEYVGLATTGDRSVSVAQMKAPPGWSEPAQTPAFTEITLVLSGEVVVGSAAGELRVGPGQALIARPGETVQYRAGDGGAEYVAVCLPAFAEDAAGRVSIS